MSLFQFLASNTLLEEVRNPFIEFLSMNEAIRRNIEPGYIMVNDKEIDNDEKIMMICDSEEHLNEIIIFHDMYHSPIYAEEYSEKKYFAELQWQYSKERVNKLIDYLKDQLTFTDEIEIWSIWIDEHKPANIKSVNIDELNIKDLEFLDISKGYETPRGVIIKK
ncbi:MAG: hypothetical protein K0R34_575 [Herbinix sp.]|jgi:hypothetical protein|nr:hypothetical protein [Herbinix sp.]